MFALSLVSFASSPSHLSTSAAMATELTFIMIKPDGVQRGLIGDIISRFEKKGFFLKALKLIQVERSFAEKHYSDLSTKPFFGALVEYIISGPVVAMVWQGKGVVATGRKIIGATNPAQSEPGTIRGDFCIEVSRNVIHGSDAVESAQKEIALWFPEGVTEWRSSVHPWIYEN
jgi:nucleoside-diphosphate kinase